MISRLQRALLSLTLEIVFGNYTNCLLRELLLLTSTVTETYHYCFSFTSLCLSPQLGGNSLMMSLCCIILFFLIKKSNICTKFKTLSVQTGSLWKISVSYSLFPSFFFAFFTNILFQFLAGSPGNFLQILLLILQFLSCHCRHYLANFCSGIPQGVLIVFSCLSLLLPILAFSNMSQFAVSLLVSIYDIMAM